MGFEELLNELEQENYENAFKIAEDLRKQGVKLPLIRFNIYPYFLRLKFKEIEKAERLIRTFKGYDLKYWLK